MARPTAKARVLWGVVVASAMPTRASTVIAQLTSCCSSVSASNTCSRESPDAWTHRVVASLHAWARAVRRAFSATMRCVWLTIGRALRRWSSLSPKAALGFRTLRSAMVAWCSREVSILPRCAASVLLEDTEGGSPPRGRGRAAAGRRRADRRPLRHRSAPA
eukprot:3857634-Prymnesium_polylepis.2